MQSLFEGAGCGGCIANTCARFRGEGFSSRFILFVYLESPTQKKPEDPTPQAPNPINWKHQTQKPNPRPQPSAVQ